MRNPIHNAIVPITKRDIVSCKRCGCPGLAWVKFKSGKSGLVETAVQRPFWRGQGPAPEGLFALKFNYHNCEAYKANKLESERRASMCHPKADNPAAILADAARVIINECVADKYEQLKAGKGPLFEAMEIILNAQSQVPNIKGWEKGGVRE